MQRFWNSWRVRYLCVMVLMLNKSLKLAESIVSLHTRLLRLSIDFRRFLHWILLSSRIVDNATDDPFPLLSATGPGNLPAVRVRTGTTVLFGSKPIQQPDPLHLGRPYPDLYPSIRGFCLVWPDPSVPISGSGIRVFLLIIAFRYPVANRKILTLVYCCPCLMYWPPL